VTIAQRIYRSGEERVPFKYPSSPLKVAKEATPLEGGESLDVRCRQGEGRK